MNRKVWLALGSVLALAFAVRLLHFGLVPPAPVGSDASGYDAAARRLIASGTYAFPMGRALWSDDVFREDAWGAFEHMPPNAFSMPGYPWFLAGIYRLSGTGPERFQAARVVQALIASLTLALLFLVGDTVLGRRAAWAGLALNALYPPSVWATQYLLTETLFTLLLVAQVALMVWAARSRRLLAYGGLGVATAAAVYVRPVAVLVPVLLLALETYRTVRGSAAGRALPGQAARFAVLGLTITVLMAPWWIRNQRLYGVFMPTTSASVLPPVQGELLIRGLPVPDESYAQYALPALTGNDDHAYAVGVAKRIRAIMPPASPTDRAAAQLERMRMLGSALTSPFAFPVTRDPLPGWQPVMQVAILALASIGLWRHRHRADALLLLGGVAATIILVHWQVSMLTPRYLYPAMPLLLLLAAAALGPARRGRGRPAPSR